MKFVLIQVGRTEQGYLVQAIEEYIKRLGYYCNFSTETIHLSKKVSDIENQKSQEFDAINTKLNQGDYIVLLDEKGKQYTSFEFSSFIEKQIQLSYKRIVFIIAGPYGAHDKLKAKSYQLMSLSKMTFSHQMVRLFFVEQLYRAFTIIKGEKYHHD